MSDWKQGAAHRRDERATKLEETTPGPARHKDKKRWCKGRVGREHKGVCHNYNELKRWGLGNKYVSGWKILVCTVCGKELETWYGNPKNRPEWAK
jgi:hypothetical protein